MRPHAMGLSRRAFPRAVVSGVRAQGRQGRPEDILSELQSAFGDFQERYDARLADITAQLDETARRGSALLLNGPASHSGRASAAIRAGLGTFAKTGAVPQASMTIGSDPDGGYLVPEELSTEIISLQRSQVAMRNVARTLQINSASFKQPVNKHGSGSGWVGESDGRPPTNGVQLALMEYTPYEVYANPGVSQTLLDDSAINIADFIMGEIADEFSQQEGTAFITGNGIAKPRGLVTYTTVATSDATRPFGEFQYIPGGDASDLPATAADQLRALVFTLKARYRKNATWLMNSVTQSVVANWKDTLGRPLWQSSLGVGTPDTLMGYPVEIDDGMPDVAANALPIAFGDFKRGYMIVDRMPVRMLRDPLTNKPFVQFYTTKRVGGGALDTTAIKFLKIATA